MEEMTSIEENGTWSLIGLPLGCKAIRVKWVFKVKQYEHGVVSKHKACLMVKAYAQWHDINYVEALASVAQHDSVRCSSPSWRTRVGRCTIWMSNQCS
jgi:hypothetical protein